MRQVTKKEFYDFIFYAKKDIISSVTGSKYPYDTYFYYREDNNRDPIGIIIGISAYPHVQEYYLK